MNRRTAVRNIVIISAGASFLPACSPSTDEPSFHLKNIPLSGSQENMVADLTETIIPGTSNFAGAKFLKSHVFVFTMVDDCASPEDQKAFSDGMKAFEEACKTKFHQSFVKCNPQQKTEILNAMRSGKDENDNAVKFYNTVRRYTIQDFTSSKDYLLNIKKWKMIPGPDFKGCVPVKA